MSKPSQPDVLLSSTALASGPIRDAGNTMPQTAQKGEGAMDRIGDSVSRFSKIGTFASTTGNSVLAVFEKPIAAFVRLDDALTALQVTMMDSSGQVGAAFSEIKKQTIELGNALPGSTMDFVNVANALIERGTAIEAVTGGALKAASHLSVVLNMPGHAAGEMVSELRETYGLADGELTYMADRVQRARFAFGMKPDDIKAAASDQAPALNMLGIKGAGNLAKMLAIQGIGAQAGREGASFDTDFSMMLSRLTKGPLMIAEAKKGMKAETRELMNTMGIGFNFFDKKGNFAGLDHMVNELEKLKTIKEKLGGKAALEVAEAMFGAEAARPAMILAEKGWAGYQQALQKMEKQASLQQRIERITHSTKNMWETLTDSIENIMATLAEPAIEWFKPVLGDVNEIVGKFGQWLRENQKITKWAAIATASAGGLFVAIGTVSLAASMLGKVFDEPRKLINRLRGKGGNIAETLSAQKVFVTNWPSSLGGGLTAQPRQPGILGPDGKPIAGKRPKTRIGSAMQWVKGATGKLLDKGRSILPGFNHPIPANTGWLGKLQPVGSTAGKLASKAALPLAVGMALFSAGDAMANDKLTGSEKGTAVGEAAGGLTGSLAGGLAGAKLGALVGTAVFPGVGTALGGLLGGAFGGLTGDWIGARLGGAMGAKLAGADQSKAPPTPAVAANKRNTPVLPAPAKPPSAVAALKSASVKSPAPIEIKMEYKPQITIHGDPTPHNQQRFKEMLQSHQQTLEMMFKRMLAEQQRRAY